MYQNIDMHSNGIIKNSNATCCIVCIDYKYNKLQIKNMMIYSAGLTVWVSGEFRLHVQKKSFYCILLL